jgi:hypothetical protein
MPILLESHSWLKHIGPIFLGAVAVFVIIAVIGSRMARHEWQPYTEGRMRRRLPNGEWAYRPMTDAEIMAEYDARVY